MGNPFTAPNLGDSNGGVFDLLKQQFVQKLSPTAQAAQPKDPTLDLLSPEAVSERQAAAAKMRDGLNSAFGTRDAAGNISLRGTDLQNQATATAENAATQKQKDQQNAPDAPVIPPPPTDPDAPYQDPKDDSERQANDRYENGKRYRDRTGKSPASDTVIQ